MVVQGILFPQDWLTTDWFSIFATVVAINTLVYVVLGTWRFQVVNATAGD